MQRVSALLPSWGDRSNRNSAASGKISLDKVRGWADKIPSPSPRLSTSSTQEWHSPAPLDRECEKAARILRSFCLNGFLVPDDRPGSPSTTSSGVSTNRILKKIPPRIIQNAVGLAVFTSMRSGLWTSGSGGSGILIARKTDGTWSPPSGLLVQSASHGFILGYDICDCVVVINSFTTLEVFGRPKITLGTDVQIAGSPVVSVGLLENELSWADLSDSVFTYVKSKGKSTDMRLDGSILAERADENERFYGCNFSVAKILAGDVNQSLPQLRLLTEVLKAAEGRTDYDATLLEQLANQPTPGDGIPESPISTTSLSPAFGVPNDTDPDPFGVLALGMAGIEIREAGTHLRPESSQFDYCPSPASPLFPRSSRRSVDTFHSRSNRGSYMSSRTMATEQSHATDAGMHTGVNTAATTPSPGQSEIEYQHSIEEIPEIKEPESKEPEEVDYTKIDISALRSLSNFPDLDDDPVSTMNYDDTFRIGEDASLPAVPDDEPGLDADDEDDVIDDELDDSADDDEEFEDAEEPVIFEVATAQAPRAPTAGAQAVQMKGAVVTIPRRVPPPLPTRSPARLSRRSKTEFGELPIVSSPLRNEFEFAAQPVDIATPQPEESFPAQESDHDVGLATSDVSNDIENAEKSSHTDTLTRMLEGHSPNRFSQESQTSTLVTVSSPNDDEHEEKVTDRQDTVILV